MKGIPISLKKLFDSNFVNFFVIIIYKRQGAFPSTVDTGQVTELKNKQQTQNILYC